MNDEVYFWLGVKHQSFLQVDTLILGVGNKPCQKYQKNEICVSLWYLQKDMGNEVDFLPADQDECFL